MQECKADGILRMIIGSAKKYSNQLNLETSKIWDIAMIYIEDSSRETGTMESKIALTLERKVQLDSAENLITFEALECPMRHSDQQKIQPKSSWFTFDAAICECYKTKELNEKIPIVNIQSDKF